VKAGSGLFWLVRCGGMVRAALLMLLIEFWNTEGVTGRGVKGNSKLLNNCTRDVLGGLFKTVEALGVWGVAKSVGGWVEQLLLFFL
jgi:hypothetical protein